MEKARQYELDREPFHGLVGQDLFGFVYETSPPVVRTRLAKALDHFTRAQRLGGVDDEMGVIRLIAGEEELVVALFEWLKLQSEHFPEHRDFVKQFKKHPVKQSLPPVLAHFRRVIVDLISSPVTIDGLEDHVSWTVKPVVDETGVGLSFRDGEGQEVLRHEPLSVGLSLADLGDDEVADKLFESFGSAVSEQGLTVGQFILQRADYRNRLLYASDEGVVVMKDSLDELLELFRDSYRDLLWTLALVLGGAPPSTKWGLVSQFFRVYRRVLAEAGLIKAA